MDKNIYTFNRTIYDGNCNIDFYFFCLKKKISIIRFLPATFIAMLLYILNIKDKDYLNYKIFQFVIAFDNLNDITESFWKKNSKKIKKWFLKQKKNNDIIVSNIPNFIMDYIGKKLNVNIISTTFIIEKNEVQINGYDGITKAINSLDKSTKFKNLYIDSLNNNDLMLLTKKAFVVKKDKFIAAEEYKENCFEKLKNIFFARDFLMFLVIGVINTFDVIWMSLLYSLIMKDSIAFIFGWMTSLVVAYSLNSLLNYKEKLKFEKLVSFGISNIPNFFIQNITAFIVLDILNWNKLISYFIAAIIGVPVTFICIKLFVFNRRK